MQNQAKSAARAGNIFTFRCDLKSGIRCDSDIFDRHEEGVLFDGGRKNDGLRGLSAVVVPGNVCKIGSLKEWCTA